MSMLDAQLEELTVLTPAQLRARWREVHRSPAPDVGPDLLRRGIAYRLQERVHGKLSSVTLRKLERLARKLEAGEDVLQRDVSLKPGTRLMRSWHGTVHQVLVCDSGFEFDGRRYRSLSQIARDITGAHWSGPRFFGLTGHQDGEATAAHAG